KIDCPRSKVLKLLNTRQVCEHVAPAWTRPIAIGQIPDSRASKKENEGGRGHDQGVYQHTEKPILSKPDQFTLERGKRETSNNQRCDSRSADQRCRTE